MEKWALAQNWVGFFAVWLWPWGKWMQLIVNCWAPRPCDPQAARSCLHSAPLFGNGQTWTNSRAEQILHLTTFLILYHCKSIRWPQKGIHLIRLESENWTFLNAQRRESRLLMFFHHVLDCCLSRFRPHSLEMAEEKGVQLQRFWADSMLWIITAGAT